MAGQEALEEEESMAAVAAWGLPRMSHMEGKIRNRICPTIARLARFAIELRASLFALLDDLTHRNCWSSHGHARR